MRYYYVNANNETTGPVDENALKELLLNKEINLSTNILREGDPEGSWTPLSRIPEFADVVPPPPPPVSSPSFFAGDWQMMPGEFVEKFLTLSKNWLSEARANQVREQSVRFGHYALVIAGVVGLLSAIIAAIRFEQAELVFIGILFIVLLAVAQFTARRFLHSCAALLRATPTRTSTTSIYDVIALVYLVLGIALFLGMTYGAIRGGGYALLGILFALVTLLIFLSLAAASLHTRMLNIETAHNSSAGEEAVGILGYFLKLIPFMAPVIFGLFTILGALIQMVAVFIILFNEHALYALSGMLPPAAGGSLAALGGVMIALYGALTPFIAYLLFLLYYLILDIVRSIVSIPAKLDALNKNR